jgi:hypothetical protein
MPPRWPHSDCCGYRECCERDSSRRKSSAARCADGTNASVVVSTVCVVHNWHGRIYLFFVVPFHRWGVKLLLSRAIAAGRL